MITISTVGYGETSQLSPRVQALTVAVILVGVSASVYTFGGLFQLIVGNQLDAPLAPIRILIWGPL